MESAEKTVGSLVQFFEKLITDFSWRRLGFVAGFIVLVGLVLIVYESYTQTFRLARLEREAALLKRILELQEASQGSTDPDILRSLDGLKQELRHMLEPRAVVVFLTPGWRKAIYTTIPWGVMALLVLFSSGASGGAALLGMGLFFIPLTVLNMNLPDFQPTWVNHWLIPWGETVVVVLSVMAWQKRKRAV